MSDAEIAELLSQDPNGEGNPVCWSALARVVDDDPTFVYGDGDESGMTVTCMILTGPFEGAEVAAMVSCPLGSGTELSPFRGGDRVLLHFLDGDLDGLIVAAATVPGGKERPLPKATAGIKVDEEGLRNNRIIKPGKGVNYRLYMEGAACVIRLKGAVKGDAATGDGRYAGELYVEADDAPNDDSSGTFIRLVIDPVSGKFAIKLATAQGAFVNLLDDQVTLASGNNENQLTVNNDGVTINAKTLNVQAGTVSMLGTILLNYAPPLNPVPITPAFGGAAFAKVGGAVAGVAEVSKTVFIGA